MNGEKIFDAWAWRLHSVGIRPNHLTLLQALPMMGLAVTGYRGDFLLFAFFQLLVVLVDGADGILARRTHTTSRRGHLLDSLFDIIGIGLTLWVVSVHHGSESVTDSLMTMGTLAYLLLFVNFLVYIQNEIQGTKSVTYTRGPVTAGLILADWYTQPLFVTLGLVLPLLMGLVLMVTRVDWRRRLWNYYQFFTAGRRREYKATPRAERAGLTHPTGTDLPGPRARAAAASTKPRTARPPPAARRGVRRRERGRPPRSSRA